MIIGTVTINTPTGIADIPVEITHVIDVRGRKLASVRALSGQPFTVFTHGGPAQTDSIYVAVEHIREKPIQVLQDPT
jgi:hypothetical protein